MSEYQRLRRDIGESDRQTDESDWDSDRHAKSDLRLPEEPPAAGSHRSQRVTAADLAAVRATISDPIEVRDLPTLGGAPGVRTSSTREVRFDHVEPDEAAKALLVLGGKMSPVQVLVAVQRHLAHVLSGRLSGSGVQIMADLTPEQCREFVAAGGTRSDPAAGVVSLVSLEVGGIELVGAESPEPGSPEDEAERLAFARAERDGKAQYGPTGEAIGVAVLVSGAREVYGEVKAEQLAHYLRQRDVEDDRIRALERAEGEQE